MRIRGVVALVGAASVLVMSSLACCFSVPVGGRWRWPWETVQGSGDVLEETREVAGFTGVSLRGIGQLHIEQAESEGLRIEAEDNLLPYLETRLEGRTLVIGTKPEARLRPTRPIIFRVAVRELHELAVSGSGDAEGPGLQVEDLSITVSGSGNVSLLDIKADGVRVRISGSGNVELSGLAREQELTVSGSGDYRARELASDESTVRISGSGSATIQVSDRLDVTVSGSGSVRYVGSPTVQTRITGSGSVRQIDD
jgi:hypothetical protein